MKYFTLLFYFFIQSVLACSKALSTNCVLKYCLIAKKVHEKQKLVRNIGLKHILCHKSGLIHIPPVERFDIENFVYICRYSKQNPVRKFSVENSIHLFDSKKLCGIKLSVENVFLLCELKHSLHYQVDNSIHIFGLSQISEKEKVYSTNLFYIIGNILSYVTEKFDHQFPKTKNIATFSLHSQVMKFEKVVFGNYDQAHKMFGNNAGKQCFANSLFSLCWARVRRVNIWKSFDLDFILQNGNQVFKDTNLRSFKICDFPKEIVIEGNHFNIKISRQINGNDKDIVINKYVLFDKSIAGAILFLDNIYCIAILKNEEHEFFLFDPHSLDEGGKKVDEGGKSIFIKFSTEKDVLEYLHSTHSFNHYKFLYFEISGPENQSEVEKSLSKFKRTKLYYEHLESTERKKKFESKKQRNKKHYKENSETYKENARKNYTKNSESKKESARKIYKEDPKTKKEQVRKHYKEKSETIKEQARKHYEENSETRKEKARKRYEENSETRKEKFKEYHQQHAEEIKERKKRNYQECSDEWQIKSVN